MKKDAFKVLQKSLGLCISLVQTNKHKQTLASLEIVF